MGRVNRFIIFLRYVGTEPRYLIRDVSKNRGVFGFTAMKNSGHKINLGRWGEKVAENFLRRQGCDILQNNYRCRGGEIDIVAEDKKQLVFIEVKTRLNNEFGTPEEGFHYFKRERFKKAIADYLIKYDIDRDDYRIDLIGIEIDRFHGRAKIRHWPYYEPGW